MSTFAGLTWRQSGMSWPMAAALAAIGLGGGLWLRGADLGPSGVAALLALAALLVGIAQQTIP